MVIDHHSRRVMAIDTFRDNPTFQSVSLFLDCAIHAAGATPKCIICNKGQHWGNAKGNHGAQKPADVGTAVRSTCQTWLEPLAVTTREHGAASPGPDCGASFNIRPTVVTPRCSPDRHSVSAILTLPMLGFRVFRRSALPQCTRFHRSDLPASERPGCSLQTTKLPYIDVEQERVLFSWIRS